MLWTDAPSAARWLLLAAMFALAGCGGARQAKEGASAEASPPAFAVCANCHSADRNGSNRVGPTLHGVVGRKAGTAPGFPYSAALRDSGIVWTAETLDRFLAGPAKMIPGTRMTLSVSDPAERRAIITYLAEHSLDEK